MAKEDFKLPLPQQLSQEVDRLFDELIYRPWGSRAARETADWDPQLDLYETDTAFVLEADLPGVKEEDVKVSVEDGDLVLQGQRTFERTHSGSNFHRHERRAGHFVRRLRLPASVDQAQIRAEFGSGVLRVTLPKIQRERKTER
jgi:HSP20 family protein